MPTGVYVRRPHSAATRQKIGDALKGRGANKPGDMWRLVEKTATCWLWKGPVTSRGYGQFMAQRKSLAVHRLSYTLLKGPIPKGLVLDHLCRVKICVNPEHLEPVTNEENILRGDGSPAVNARKTHCKRGHELAGDNLYTPSNRPNHRGCRKCRYAASRKSKQLQRLSAPYQAKLEAEER